MKVLKKVNEVFEETFAIKEKNDDKGYMHYLAGDFQHGLIFRVRNLVFKVPILVPITLGGTMTVSLIMMAMSSPEVEYISTIPYIIITMTPVVCGLEILANRKKIQPLSEKIDVWHRYRYFDSECEAMKEKAESFTNLVAFFFRRWMSVGVIGVCFLPLIRLSMKGRDMEPMEMLIFPCWAPFSLEEWNGAFLGFLYQAIMMSMILLTYMRPLIYFTAATIHIGHQSQLIGDAFLTMEVRVKKLVSNQQVANEEEWTRIYIREMEEEIKSCAIHYQKLIECINMLGNMFKGLLNLCSHAAMWVWCLFGVQIATDTSGNAFSVQAAMLLSASFCSALILSIVIEALITNIENLQQTIYFSPWHRMPLPCQKSFNIFQLMLVRIPQIRTIMGTQINMDNFSKIINTAYCYFSFIIAMMNKK